MQVGRASTRRVSFIPGATTESGSQVVTFRDMSDQIGAVLYKATLTGDGVESEYSQHTFTVVVSDAASGQGSSTLSLSESEYPVAFAGIESSTLLFHNR